MVTVLQEHMGMAVPEDQCKKTLMQLEQKELYQMVAVLQEHMGMEVPVNWYLLPFPSQIKDFQAGPTYAFCWAVELAFIKLSYLNQNALISPPTLSHPQI